MTTLSEHQSKVLKAFDAPNKDIDIAVLYMRVYGDPGDKTSRGMQQRLAPIFSAINTKLGTATIEPGEVKRTYRYNKKV